MTSTVLANELANLISEAKRKNQELRTAAEKSLQDLKSLPATSEQQLAADLSRRSSFIEPFLLACATRNARFAGSGLTCLQRLVVSRGLPRSKLQETLEAFNACTDLGLESQLKILQALPSLLQNYAEDLKGDLLSGALEVCSSLQSAKAQTVSGVAAATLQQLVTSVFEKVVTEDARANNVPAQNEVPGQDGPLKLRPAAFDAYRVFRDLALAAENRRTKFVQFESLSEESSLELIWSCMNANPTLFATHEEFRSTIRSNVLPFVTRALSEKLSYQLTLRSLRLLDSIISRHISQFSAECEVALGLLIHTLDPDAAPMWKRATVMEILRNFFADGVRVVDAYALYDITDGGKPIVQDLMSVFVRLSSEKPSIIGLGQQSTIPVGPMSARDTTPETPSLEAAGGVAGMISSALGVAETNVAGISSKWSLPRSPCLEQLDKTDAPTVPETYIYALVLECLNSLSDGLAKTTLPLTVQHEKSRTESQPELTANGDQSNGARPSGRSRSHSYRKRAAPINPLDHKGRTATRVQAVHGFVDSCWPAVLATSSTFLNAAIDDQYYRNLIKAYQRFAQVAGLLRLSTARDALMTTLGKAAVPPHILNAATADPPKTPSTESPRVFSNPKGLLSVDTLVSQTSSLSIDRDRRGSVEPSRPMLTTRNLLCLRAELNLAIALGPTLDTAYGVVVDTLRQADTVLSATSPQQMVRQGLTASQKGSESPNVVQAFTNEINAVESAASRLLESTADYPNEAFLNVLNTFCRLLHGRDPSIASSPRINQTSPPPTPSAKSRTFSGLTGISSLSEMRLRDYKFVVPKLGSLAAMNIARFVADEPDESGWNILVDELVTIASKNAHPKEARRAATDVLCKIAAEMVSEVSEEDAITQKTIQRRTFAILLRLVDGIYADEGELTATDINVQGHVVEALRAILERCGESLVAGWNRAIAIISSVFERSGTPPDRQDDEETHIDWENVSKELVSVELGKAAFAATQLICSDFLSALSGAVMPSLIELLYRFAVQSDDLNICLSTVTMAWNVSDFLLSGIAEDDLARCAREVKEADDFEEEVQTMVRTSRPAQWLLLLLRLQQIIGDGHREVRKAAFQTLCSIFKNHGEQSEPSTWDLTLRSIILRVAFHDSFLYHNPPAKDETKAATSGSHDESVSSAIIAGTADIVSHHLRVIEQISKLPSLWEAFLARMEAYLDLESLLLNTAVYQALRQVLAHISVDSKSWTGPMYRTLHLWLKRNPANIEVESKGSNQESFSAYIEAGIELYRLTEQGMSVSQTRTFVENVYLVLRHSNGPRYGADASSLSPLQSKSLDLLKGIRSDTPTTLVIVASKLVTLHHDGARDGPANERPAFIALAGESIDWLQQLVLSNISDAELLESDVVTTVIHSLRDLIEEKYNYAANTKGTPLWRKATTAAVALALPVLEQCSQADAEPNVKLSLWTEYVGALSGVVKAKGIDEVQDPDKVYEDELFDIESFSSIKRILVPNLGIQEIRDTVRTLLARALFDASIIHATESGEIPGEDCSPLQDLDRIRLGRVRRVPSSRREDMCYECISELVRLSTSNDDSPGSKRLAQAAAPLLILRLAIPIRAYIADQPLRGRRPQPLSELEELLYCFDTVARLELHPEALAGDNVAHQRQGKKAHLHYLYPLLVKAVGTAGDRWSGADEVLTPLQAVLQSITPLPQARNLDE
ncbi:Endocytosis and vacuole integrity protein [Saxophila tyrrhenica]|uniref:Endocytosis and vacuole integrity protein n=1 Tax=Saxophila tyrrhenica TaxID=1690608 RepID=A0AAV9P958_9PEZI|nr:Endocytosis and vacuole integrity protein [Saxophila tyrrhenica]